MKVIEARDAVISDLENAGRIHSIVEEQEVPVEEVESVEIILLKEW